MSSKAESNRLNSQKSTGPRTSAGKLNSSMNSLSHGLRARMTLLPGEDPDAYDALHQSFRDEFQPRTQSEHDLIDTMTYARWAQERARRQEQAALAQRLAAVEADGNCQRHNTFAHLTQYFKSTDDPARSLSQLERMAEGRAWVLARWRALGGALGRYTGWDLDEAQEAIRLLGHHPRGVFAAEPVAQEVLVAFLGAQFTHCAPHKCVLENELGHVQGGPKNQGLGPHVDRLFALLPPVAEAQARLAALVAAQIARWEAAPGEVEPDPAELEARAEAMELALFDSSPVGTLRARYLNTQLGAYSRALRDLIALRKHRRPEGADESDAEPDRRGSNT